MSSSVISNKQILMTILFVLILNIVVQGNEKIIKRLDEVVDKELADASYKEANAFWKSLIRAEIKSVNQKKVDETSADKLVNDFFEYFRYIGNVKYNLNEEQEEFFRSGMKNAVIYFNAGRKPIFSEIEYAELQSKIETQCLQYSHLLAEVFDKKSIVKIKTSKEFYHNFCDAIESSLFLYPVSPGINETIQLPNYLTKEQNNMFVEYLKIYVFQRSYLATMNDLVATKNLFLMLPENKINDVKNKILPFNHESIGLIQRKTIANSILKDELVFNPSNFCNSLLISVYSKQDKLNDLFSLVLSDELTITIEQ